MVFLLSILTIIPLFLYLAAPIRGELYSRLIKTYGDFIIILGELELSILVILFILAWDYFANCGGF